MVLLGVAGCTEFPPIPADECGNAVVEDAEDCDTFVDAKGAYCRPKGVEGECHFDCSTGSDGARFICPDDMGCGADGLCRFPTGDFERAAKFADEVSGWVSAADFDADGRDEIISTEPPDQVQEARFRLHYFDPDLNLEQTSTFPRFTTRPIARDVTADGIKDLVFSNFRVGMVPGRADRDWVPATFSSYKVPDSDIRVAGVRDDFIGGAVALVALTTLGGVFGVYVPDFITGRLALRVELPASVARLAGEPLPADLVEGSDSPCDELVVAFRKDSSFRVFDMCMRSEDEALPEVVWRDAPLEQVVRLPDGLTIDAGPIVADVDGDGHLDVLIGAAGRPYVAHGDGAALESVAQPLAVPFSGTDGMPRDLPMPLAAGDLTGDGVADYVLPAGIWGSRRKLDASGTAYFLSFENRADPWSMAQIADFNGNELLDVVAASDGSLGLALLNGTGGPYQIGARFPTRGPVRLLVAGDFDGDLSDDVAFVEAGPPARPGDSLAIAFGVRDSVPTTAKRIADLDGVRQLGKHHELGMDNLFTSSQHVIDGALYGALTLFDGSPDRLPLATYTLTTFSSDGQLIDSAAPALVLGALTSRGASDVLALGTREPTRDWALWLLADIGGGQRSPRLLDSERPEMALPVTIRDDVVTLSVAGTVADLDGDGLDEALWLMPEGEAGCALLAYAVDAAAGRAEQVAYVSFGEPCTTPELAAADMDADGALDVLTLLGQAPDGSRHLEVLWNDGTGRFSRAAGNFVPDQDGQDVRGFHVFGHAPEAQPEARVPARLAFVTERGLTIARANPAGDARRFDVVELLDDFDDARSVVVGDPNGDGLLDIVVADAEGLWLLGAELE